MILILNGELCIYFCSQKIPLHNDCTLVGVFINLGGLILKSLDKQTQNVFMMKRST
jgi:hypothetical protein